MIPLTMSDYEPDDDDKCVLCGLPATEWYGETDTTPGTPWCGRWSCGVSMQAAADYHDERGG